MAAINVAATVVRSSTNMSEGRANRDHRSVCESFNATLECELLVKRRFKNQREAALAIFKFIEGWYNPRRRHTPIRKHFTHGVRAAHGSGGVMSNQHLSTKADLLQASMCVAQHHGRQRVLNVIQRRVHL